MKLFFKLLFAVIILEIIISISCTYIIEESSSRFLVNLSHLIIIFLSFPVYLIDKSYPFYSDGSANFGFMLVLINVLLQTLILYAFIRITTKKKN
ncbi:hypothetical protein [Flavobacterium microcysteis]|uniref:Uncharacterized protein n=1 Tax=Flavobacterium microcysteis TaxID=2596891 RepID=A0A501Q477_9FLAO|nr:hypothetical protein [Flavobacterium microcysteis]TPD67152.1 hypothetical protein FJA49_12795 [Flavobacterium microcysteis]